MEFQTILKEIYFEFPFRAEGRSFGAALTIALAGQYLTSVAKFQPVFWTRTIYSIKRSVYRYINDALREKQEFNRSI